MTTDTGTDETRALLGKSDAFFKRERRSSKLRRHEAYWLGRNEAANDIRRDLKRHFGDVLAFHNNHALISIGMTFKQIRAMIKVDA